MMSVEFPKVRQNDPSDVAAAIETAQVLWRNGDLRESLRWVRRAAEAAETEGDDQRALSLARAAAELQEQHRLSTAQRAPESVAPATSRSVPPPARSSAPPPPPSRTSSAAPARSSAPPVRSSAPPPPSRAPAPAERASAPPARPTTDLAAALNVPLASKLEPWVPREQRGAPGGGRPPSRPEPAPVPLEAKPGPAGEEFRSELDTVPRSEPLPPSSVPTPRTERRAPPESDARTAVRVAVAASATSPGTFTVTLLGEDERPEKGTFEALLVPLARGVDLRALS